MSVPSSLMKKIVAMQEGLGAGLHKSESGSLIAHGVVGNAFPNERLQPFPMVLAQIHESNRKLTARHPNDMS
jgi:hypothetical protein